MPNLEILDLNLAQERMPCCPLCDNPVYSGEPVVIGRVRAHGQVAFGLCHQSCAEDN